MVVSFFLVEKDENTYNIFIENLSGKDGNLETAILKEKSKEITFDNTKDKFFQLSLQAYLNHRKVEIEVDCSLQIKKITLL